MTNALTVQNPKNIRRNRKGFTLIELIVVIAILAILAAIAIPAFTNIQNNSKVKADAATAAEICNAARIQEADSGTALTAIGDLKTEYMTVGIPQSGDASNKFSLTKNDGKYVVSWTATNAGSRNGSYSVTEGVAFKLS